jgi:hypothetical protein
LRTGPHAQATLALPRHARLLVKSDTVVRFKRSRDDSQPLSQIEMQQGELTIETGALDLGVDTARGVVRLTQGTSVRMKSEQQKTHFDVVVGRVEYALEGTTRTVEAGGGFDIEVLRPSVEPAAPQLTATAANGAPAPDAGAPPGDEAVAKSGKPAAPAELEFQDSPPGAIVTLLAGESAVIHDPAPPTDVRMRFDACPQGAVLELDRGSGRSDAIRVRGDDEVRARVPRGEYRYRLRCLHDGRLQAPLHRGRLTVMADAATRPLPSAPATITADADGRRYTVSYQNRLPIITLRWPDAPRAAAYRLFVRPDKGGAQFSLESSRSSVTLEPGRVGEGLHQFWFATADDARRSEKGLIQVSFDYAARTAYLTSPIEGAAAHDGRARFAGGTLLGSTVQAQGAPLKLDAQGRFDAEVEVPAGAGGAYVRVQHRSTGVHYYIRHLR